MSAEESDDGSVRIGMTRRVYEAVKALMAAEGLPMSIENVPSDDSDLLTVLEQMLAADEVAEIDGGPMLIVDVGNKTGEVGFYCAAKKDDGMVARGFLYFVEAGDPPAMRRLPFNGKMQIIDPRSLVAEVNPRLWFELATSARALIDLVQTKVGQDVPIAIAPVMVLGDQEIRGAVDTFNEVACMVSRHIKHKLSFSETFIRNYRRQFPKLDAPDFEMGRD